MTKIPGIKISKELEAEFNKIIEEESTAGAKPAIDYINSPEFEKDIQEWRAEHPDLLK